MSNLNTEILTEYLPYSSWRYDKDWRGHWPLHPPWQKAVHSLGQSVNSGQPTNGSHTHTLGEAVARKPRFLQVSGRDTRIRDTYELSPTPRRLGKPLWCWLKTRSRTGLDSKTVTAAPPLPKVATMWIGIKTNVRFSCQKKEIIYGPIRSKGPQSMTPNSEFQEVWAGHNVFGPSSRVHSKWE